MIFLKFAFVFMIYGFVAEGVDFPHDLLCIQCEVIFERARLSVKPLNKNGFRQFFNVCMFFNC